MNEPDEAAGAIVGPIGGREAGSASGEGDAVWPSGLSERWEQGPISPLQPAGPFAPRGAQQQSFRHIAQAAAPADENSGAAWLSLKASKIASTTSLCFIDGSA